MTMRMTAMAGTYTTKKCLRLINLVGISVALEQRATILSRTTYDADCTH